MIHFIRSGPQRTLLDLSAVDLTNLSWPSHPVILKFDLVTNESRSWEPLYNPFLQKYEVLLKAHSENVQAERATKQYEQLKYTNNQKN